jgi:hypothetical protein
MSDNQSYGLSSWNYGSFLPSNPAHNVKSVKRSQSVNLLNKRKLTQDEKIVTEEYLKAVNDNKVIKNLKRKDSFNSEHNKSLYSKNSQMKKDLKYQLSFEEWAIMKSAQNEIYKNVQMIKENEDKKFEMFNKKVDENYEQIKNDNYKEWLERKNEQQEQNKMIKIMKVEMKEKVKTNKKEQRTGKFETWIKKQAQIDEIKAYEKREIEERKRDEEVKKKAEEEQRIILAREAFKGWRERKQKHDQSARIKTNEKQNKVRSSNGLKIVIGPYSNAKILRDIQKKINTMENSDNEEGDNNEIDEQRDESSNAIDKSLNNISSINKENNSY